MTLDQGNKRPLPKTTFALFHGRLGLRQFPSAKTAMTQLATFRHPHGFEKSHVETLGDDFIECAPAAKALTTPSREIESSLARSRGSSDLNWRTGKSALALKRRNRVGSAEACVRWAEPPPMTPSRHVI